MRLVAGTERTSSLSTTGSTRSAISEHRFGNDVCSDAFYLGYSLWLILMIMNSTFFASHLVGWHYTLLRLTSLSFVCFSELLQRDRSPRTYLGYTVAAIMVVSAFRSSESVLLDCIIMIVCSRGKNFRSIARLTAWIVFVCTALTILSAFSGLIPNYQGWSGTRTRSYLGFRYALFPAQYQFLFTCLCVYLCGERLTIPKAVLLLTSAVLIYRFTFSRLSYLLSLTTIILAFVIRYATSIRLRHQRSRDSAMASRFHRVSVLHSLIGIVLSLSFVFVAIASVVLTLRYDPYNQTMIDLDGVNLLGGRLRIGQAALREFGVNLFGREMHFVGAALDIDGTAGSAEYYNFIDSLFVKMLVNYGAIFTLMFIGLATATIARAWRQEDYYLVLVLVITALHCLIDNLSLYLYYDTFLLLFATPMSKTSPD